MQNQLYISQSDYRPTLPDREQLLIEALEAIVKDYPPQESYAPPLKGFWTGPTGIAYLFLHVSSRHPRLEIASRPAIRWAEAYLTGSRDAEATNFEPAIRCGISSEALVYHAACAAVFKDVSHVNQVLQYAQEVLNTQTEAEWHSGRAGLLYLVRLICRWLPDSTSMLEDLTAKLRASIIAEGPDWRFHGNRYIGAAHGDIGTITQVALSSPTDAERKSLQQWLLRLLNWQKADGNWPVNEEVDPRPYVQFCHGAPGFVLSLKSLRRIFPDLEIQIDEALRKADTLIWREGLLKKEPSLCHGIFGNGLVLPSSQRDAFLAHATPKSIKEARAADSSIFEKANYGSEFSLLVGYWPSAAWTWLVSADPDATLIGYNDV